MAYRLTEKQIKTVIDNGSRYLADHCLTNNLHYVVTGSSGGLDSAVTLALAERACRVAKAQYHDLTSVALILPCQSEEEDTQKGIAAAKKFGAKIIQFNLDSVFHTMWLELSILFNCDIKKVLHETFDRTALPDWEWSEKVAQGNIKARLRMITLYHTAKMLRGMVLSTDNLSEFWMAFWTICGDVGDFNLIQNIMKGRELYDIADFLGVPANIISAKPGDGLKIGGSAENQLGADYRTIDYIMVSLIQRGFDPNGSCDQLEKLPRLDGAGPDLVEKIAKRCLNGVYKRRGTITISREGLGLPALKEIQL